MSSIRAVAVCGLLTFLSLHTSGALSSSAAFSASDASTGSSVAVDTLEPPTGLGVTRTGTDNDLSWTPTGDTYASGYQVYRSLSSGSGFSLLASVAGRTSSTYTDDLCSAGCEPAYESSTTATGRSDRVTLSVPSGVADGDLLLTAISVQNLSATASTPSGWTKLIERQAGTDIDLIVYFRIAGASEPGSYTFIWNDTESYAASTLRYSGTANTWSSGVTDEGYSSTQIAPSATVSVDDSLVVRLAVSDNNAISSGPSGHTTRVNLFGNSDAALAVADTTATSTGSTGTANFSGGSNDWVTATLVFAPTPLPTYYYVLRSAAGSWTSVDSGEASG